MALGYDGVIRIDTAINRDGFSKGLKEMSSELEKEVQNSEKLLDNLQNKRNDAANALQVKSSGLDEERLKLAALKKDWLLLKDTAANSNLPAAVREDAAAKIPTTELQLEKQRELIAVLEKEFQKISASVEKYDREIADASGNLEMQKLNAQEAADALAEAENQLLDINHSAETSNQYIVELSHELAALKQRQKELNNAGLGLGFQEYDDTVAKIAGISAQLKDYQKNLQSAGTAGVDGQKFLDSLRNFSKSFSNGADLSQVSGGWMKQLDQLKDCLQNAAEAAGNAWDKMASSVKQNAAAVFSAFAAAPNAGGDCAKNVLRAARHFAPRRKKMNV